MWRWADRERADMSVYRTVTERAFQDYFEPAGVSEKWLNHLRIAVRLRADQGKSLARAERYHYRCA